MFIGHYLQGQLLPLRLWTVDGNGNGVEPDEAPIATVLDGDGQRVATYTMPAKDQNTCTGWFEERANLDARYSTGRYTTVYTFVISSSPYARMEQWEIVAGGDGVGTGVGLYFYRQPQADFLLLQTDNGTLKTRRNPRVG